VKNGWFSMPGRVGDRTIDQQMKGLDRLPKITKGKTVLDIGCAEGLISLRVSALGARAVHGVEIVKAHVEVARALVGPHENISFEVGDANVWEPHDGFDVTLMLAVLHKLRNPTDAARRFAHVTREWCIVRLPPETAPVVLDDRSGRQPHDIEAALRDEGFRLDDITTSHFGEWCGWFRRVA
jgi:SAM-dependent methyltransferase